MARAPAFDAIVALPAMRVGVRAHDEVIAEICYLPPDQAVVAPRGVLAARAVRQIERYCADPDFAFDLPLAEAGTAYQRRVWRALRAIPRGRTLSYGALAQRLGSAPRAIGQACGANPFPLVVPCHRVVAADGLGGFAHARGGYLLEAKRWLLRHEGVPQ